MFLDFCLREPILRLQAWVSQRSFYFREDVPGKDQCVGLGSR
jgi:hypothetical protein